MKKGSWFLSAACGSGVHCAACRGDRGFRGSVTRAGKVDLVDFACPYGVVTEVAPPRLWRKARRLWGELRRWKRAGYPLAGRGERARRKALCEACVYYQPEGNLGWGLCRICGCTRGKLWLLSARCPHPGGARW